MKKILLSYTLLIAILFASCRKDDNPKIPDLERVPVPSLSLDDASDLQISPSDPAAFQGKVIVDLFFKSDIPPKKFDVVVIKNGDKSNSKLIQADVTTFPTTVTITGEQLIAFFGDIDDGDMFTVGVDVTTQDGITYQAFPPVGNAYGSGVANQAGGVNTTIQFAKPCTYVSDVFQGEFEVVEDEFQDTAPGDVLVLTKIDDTHFSYVYPSPVDPVPVIVTIDPLTNKTSITKQKIGSAFSWEPSYTNPYAETASSADNLVLPCDESFTVVINYTVDQGDFGNYKLKMKKKG